MGWEFGAGGSWILHRPSPLTQKGIMPKYSMSDDDMESTYGSSPPSGDSEGQSVDEANESAGASTAIVSNKLLSPDGEPLKEGDEVVVQIVKNYGDESEIKYAPKKGGEETEEEPMSTEAQELTALSEEGE